MGIINSIQTYRCVSCGEATLSPDSMCALCYADAAMFAPRNCVDSVMAGQADVKPSQATPECGHDERALFEAWASKKFGATNFSEGRSGGYVNNCLHLRWESWQARAALAASTAQADLATKENE